MADGKFKLKFSKILIKRLCVSTLRSYKDELKAHVPATPTIPTSTDLNRSCFTLRGVPPWNQWSCFTMPHSQPGETDPATTLYLCSQEGSKCEGREQKGEEVGVASTIQCQCHPGPWPTDPPPPPLAPRWPQISLHALH